MEWFKFYGKDFLADLKLRKLSVVQRLMFVCLLCHASDREDGIVEHVTDEDLLTDCDLTPLDDAYKHGIGMLENLEALGVIKIKSDHIILLKYEERQQTKLSNAERQQRFRDKKTKSNDSNEDTVTNITPSRVDKSRVDKSRVDTKLSPNSDGKYAKYFLEFWNEYPRKVGKGAAGKAWDKIEGINKDIIIKAVKAQRNQEQWKKDNGQFIPHPSTWLNQRRWEDEVSKVQKEVSFK